MGGDHIAADTQSATQNGSPPHGRGPRQVRQIDRQPSGLTPRMGGDHRGLLDLAPDHLGSPPHGRGPLFTDRARCVAVGLTPRMGGDHPAGPHNDVEQPGSPPHGRGPLKVRGPGLLVRRLTPAWAGTTATGPRTRPTPGAHPRMGGDHFARDIYVPSWLGSPPHGRGPPRCSGSSRWMLRLTPAWAGTTADSMANLLGDGGSPPHGRGPHDRGPFPAAVDGLTPAWAGTTSRRRCCQRRSRAHPRMGGDHQPPSSGPP